MGEYLKLFKTEADYEAESNKPTVSHIIEAVDIKVKETSHDYSSDYLTFVPQDGARFIFSYGGNKRYSIDNGETWTTWYSGAYSPYVSAGQKMLIKSTNPSINEEYGVAFFRATSNFDVEGNPMSLIYGDDFRGKTDLSGKDNVFRHMFSGNTYIINAENMFLAATKLPYRCYDNMFSDCSNLKTAPKVAKIESLEGTATFNYMFYRCTNLETPLVFEEDCEINLIGQSFQSCFVNCTSLKTAPNIIIKSVGHSSCSGMFYNCANLETTPVIDINTAGIGSFINMFKGCSKVNNVKCLMKNNYYNSYTGEWATQGWLDGVSTTGTFVRRRTDSWNVSGVNGIPTNWTVEYVD